MPDTRSISGKSLLLTTFRNENANLLAKVDSHVCNASIPDLRNDNDDLLAKIKELNDSLASLRVENENLITKAKDFDVCNTIISDLRTKNDMLPAKVVELKSCKPSTSIVEHVSIYVSSPPTSLTGIEYRCAKYRMDADNSPSGPPY